MDNQYGLTMPATVIRTRLRRWGNTFGVPVPPREVKRIHAKEGTEVTVRIEAEPSRENFDDVGFHLGGHSAFEHEEGAGAAVEEERKGWRRRA